MKGRGRQTTMYADELMAVASMHEDSAGKLWEKGPEHAERVVELNARAAKLRTLADEMKEAPTT